MDVGSQEAAVETWAGGGWGMADGKKRVGEGWAGRAGLASQLVAGEPSLAWCNGLLSLC